jgi:phosphatidate cytidylyltransferase
MSDNMTDVIEPVPGLPPKAEGDLAVRTASAIVMIGLAGGAFLAGGWPLNIFIGVLALGLLWEFWGLVRRMVQSLPARTFWLAIGIVYLGVAVFILLLLSSPFYGKSPVLLLLGCVIATDVGAYFTGKTLGGPKIAPKISPSKTWSGLAGGMVSSALFFVAFHRFGYGTDAGEYWWVQVLAGAVLAVVAQAGDFFESWMKRRAGVKDSGRLIPGHGGLFDRTDGMIAVLFFAGLFSLGSSLAVR